jgi:chromosome segregation ATPase
MKIKAEELYRQKLEALAAQEHEQEQRRKETEKKMTELRQELESVQGEQMELQRYPDPPDYESTALENQNYVLQMELKKYERQMEIARWQEEQNMQSHYHEDTTEIAKEQLKTAKKGVRWGKVGAVAGTVAAGGALVACNVT